MVKLDITKRVILVEDDPAYQEDAKKVLTNAGYTVTVVDSYYAAEKAMLEQFFHIAVVDLCLDRKSRKNRDGVAVLNYIERYYPDCYRLIYTVISKPEPDIVDLLSIPNPKAHGYFGKTSYPSEELKDYVRSIWNRYIKINDKLIIHAPDDIDNILFDLIEKKQKLSGVDTSNKVHNIKEHFVNVLGRLFYSEKNIVTEIILERFKKGYSDTILFKVKVKSSTLMNKIGKSVIIKFGPEKSIKDESDNYDQYVQWYIKQNLITHKIAYQSFCGYAAILFTFAGDSPQNIETLEDWFLKNDVDNSGEIDYTTFISKGIKFIFNTDYNSREWYHPEIIKKEEVIDQYYKLHIYNDAYIGAFFEDQLIRHLFLDTNNDRFLLPNSKVEICNPLRTFERLHNDEYESCIIHGDMYGANIVIKPDGEWHIIDYAYTGRGHVFYDFITLELSFRQLTFWRENNGLSLDNVLMFELDLLNMTDTLWNRLNNNKTLDPIKNSDEDQEIMLQDLKEYITAYANICSERGLELINRALRLIILLRQKAFQNFPTEPIRNYYLGLFYRSLAWLKFEEDITIEQKYHSILLAGLLADIID